MGEGRALWVVCDSLVIDGQIDGYADRARERVVKGSWLD